MIKVAAPEFLILNTVVVYEIALSMTQFSSLNLEIFHQNLKLKLSHWALILIVHCLNCQLLYKPIPLSTAAKLHQFGGPQSCQKQSLLEITTTKSVCGTLRNSLQSESWLDTRTECLLLLGTNTFYQGLRDSNLYFVTKNEDDKTFSNSDAKQFFNVFHSVPFHRETLTDEEGREVQFWQYFQNL